MKTIDCGQLRIAASYQTNSSAERTIRLAYHTLIYVEKGSLQLIHNGKMATINAHEFFLVKKYVYTTWITNWTEKEGCFKLTGFVFQEELMMKMELPVRYVKDSNNWQFLSLKANAVLQGFIKSLDAYFEAGKTIDPKIIDLKMQEVFIGMIASCPQAAAILSVHNYGKADLLAFMPDQICHNISLDELARLSGRSLSVFKREFRQLYGVSPHKWISEQRLHLAKNMLLKTERKSSDFYTELGFQELSHFSRSFKKHFGQSPSEYVRVAVLNK